MLFFSCERIACFIRSFPASSFPIGLHLPIEASLSPHVTLFGKYKGDPTLPFFLFTPTTISIITFWHHLLTLFPASQLANSHTASCNEAIDERKPYQQVFVVAPSISTSKPSVGLLGVVAAYFVYIVVLWHFSSTLLTVDLPVTLRQPCLLPERQTSISEIRQRPSLRTITGARKKASFLKAIQDVVHSSRRKDHSAGGDGERDRQHLPGRRFQEQLR